MGGLPFAFLDDTMPMPSPAQPPARLPNGGLYTGAQATGAWGNVPVVPESHIMTTQNLLSANPPKGATVQPVSMERPGNNSVVHPYHQSYAGYNGVYPA